MPKNAMMSEAPSSTPSSGRKLFERYSKKLSSQATLPRALARAAALTSASLVPSPPPWPMVAISGRFMMSLYAVPTAPPMMIW